MVNLIDSNTRILRRENATDVVVALFSGVKDLVKVRVKYLLGASLLAIPVSADPAYGDSINHGPEHALSDSQAGEMIRNSLGVKIMGVPMLDFGINMSQEDYNYYMKELARDNTGRTVGNILQAITLRTGYTLSGDDISVFIDLVVANKEGNLDERIFLYDKIINGYPVLAPHLELILTANKLNPNGENA